MKTRNQAVKAAALAAVAVAMAAVMVAPAHANLRDGGWSGMHLGFGHARQASASRSVGGMKARVSSARAGRDLLRPLRDWDLPGVLPSPIILVIGDN